MELPVVPMRRVIVGTVVACLTVVIAPWFSGGQEPVAVLAGGFALLLCVLLLWRQPEARVLKFSPLVVAYVVFVGWATLSLVWSANRYSTVLWVCEWGLAGVVFLVAYSLAGEPKGRDWMVSAYVWSAAAFCAVALFMFFSGTYERLTGLFYWANPAAAYLIPAIMIAIAKLRLKAGKRLVLWAAGLVLFWTSFLLTQSRGAELVLVLVVAFYLLLVSGNKRFWITFVFSFVLGLALSFGLAKLSTEIAHHNSGAVPGGRFAAAAKGESSSTKDRLNFLASAVEMWWTHPVLGVGAGNYGDVHPQYQQRVISASNNAHNLYAEVLAELGVAGVAVLLAMILFLAVGMLRGMAADPETLALAVGAGGLLLHFGLDIDASYPALLVLAALLLGLVYRQSVVVRGAVSWRRPVAVGVLLVPLVGLYMSSMDTVHAQAAQDDHDYPAAAGWYGSAHAGLTYNPDVVSAEGINLYTVALAFGKDSKRSLELALDRAHDAERLDPHDGQHHQLEGRVLEVQGNWKGAVVAFEEALRLDPLNHPDYALDLATAQAHNGDTAQAVRTAQSMLKLYPAAVISNRGVDPTVRPALSDLDSLIGNIRLGQGRLTEARAAAEAALEIYPQSLRAEALQRQVVKATPTGATQ